MEEQSELKNKLVKHVIYNIIGFTIIFVIFGIFIFLMVKMTTYKNANLALIESKNQILQLNEEKINLILSPSFFNSYVRKDWIQTTIDQYKEEVLVKKVVNPNIIVIIRNRKNEVLNSEDLGKLSNYINEIPFSCATLLSSTPYAGAI